MSVDTRGQAAAENLWAAEPAVDTDEMLARLHRTRRSRNRRNVALAAATAVAIAVLAGATLGNANRKTSQPVITPPDPVPSVVIRPCTTNSSLVTCASGTRFRGSLPVPVTAELPRTFANGIGIDTEYSSAFFHRRVGDNGVEVHEGVVVVRADRHQTPGVGTSLSPDPTVGDTPEAVYLWLASRPYLHVFDARATTVAGHPAYEVEFAGNGSRPGPRSRQMAYSPLFGSRQPHEQYLIGYETGMKVRCWLLDVPGVGLTLIWSYTGDDRADLANNQQLVNSLQFEP